MRTSFAWVSVLVSVIGCAPRIESGSLEATATLCALCAGPGQSVVKARVVSWGEPEIQLFSFGFMEFTPVTINVVESIRGGIPAGDLVVHFNRSIDDSGLSDVVDFAALKETVGIFALTDIEGRQGIGLQTVFSPSADGYRNAAGFAKRGVSEESIRSASTFATKDECTVEHPSDEQVSHSALKAP